MRGACALMFVGPTTVATVPGWEHLPPGTEMVLYEHPGFREQTMVLRTGTLTTTHRFDEIIGWRTNHDAVLRAWHLLMLRHWWRLAYDRGGYC